MVRPFIADLLSRDLVTESQLMLVESVTVLYRIGRLVDDGFDLLLGSSMNPGRCLNRDVRC